MIVEGLQCWRCSASLDEVGQPFARAAECPACNADLHVCKLCGFFDPDARRGCKEPIAEEVNSKERSNFCGYFQPCKPALSDAAAETSTNADLEALFGLASGASERTARTADEARSALDELFGGSGSVKP